MRGRVWTREKLIETIRTLNEQGVDLSPTAIQKTHGALFSSARSRSHFGSWRAAIAQSGLDYETIKRVEKRWCHASIIEQIRLYNSLDEDLLHPDFKTHRRDLYLAACAHRYFGSWRRALLAAGLDHEKMRETRIWTKARIRRTIRELAARGETLGWSSVELNCPGIYRAARRPENYGSWKNALAAAGVTAGASRRGRKSLPKIPQSISEIDATVIVLTHVSHREFDATPQLCIANGAAYITDTEREVEMCRAPKKAASERRKS